MLSEVLYGCDGIETVVRDDADDMICDFCDKPDECGAASIDPKAIIVVAVKIWTGSSRTIT